MARKQVYANVAAAVPTRYSVAASLSGGVAPYRRTARLTGGELRQKMRRVMSCRVGSLEIRRCCRRPTTYDDTYPVCVTDSTPLLDGWAGIMTDARRRSFAPFRLIPHGDLTPDLSSSLGSAFGYSYSHRGQWRSLHQVAYHSTRLRTWIQRSIRCKHWTWRGNYSRYARLAE